MPIPAIAIQNISGSLLDLPRLGVSVPVSGTLTLTDSLFVYEILSDLELHDALEGGLATLTVDGVPLTSSALSPLAPTVDAFSAVDTTGGQQFTGSIIVVNLNVERFASSDTYTLSNDEVTVNSAGRYLVSFTTSVVLASGNRTQATSYVDTNNSFTLGTRGEMYVRQSGYGATAAHVFPADLSAGDTLRLRAVRTVGNGTVQTLASGSGLSLVRIG